MDIPAVETAGFKMIDVNRASILSTKFRTARNKRPKIDKEMRNCNTKTIFIFDPYSISENYGQ